MATLKNRLLLPESGNQYCFSFPVPLSFFSWMGPDVGPCLTVPSLPSASSVESLEMITINGRVCSAWGRFSSAQLFLI